MKLAQNFWNIIEDGSSFVYYTYVHIKALKIICNGFENSRSNGGNFADWVKVEVC